MDQRMIKTHYKLLKPYLGYSAGTIFEPHENGYIQLTDSMARYPLGGMLRNYYGGLVGEFKSGSVIEFYIDPTTIPDLFEAETTMPKMSTPVESVIKPKPKKK